MLQPCGSPQITQDSDPVCVFESHLGSFQCPVEEEGWTTLEEASAGCEPLPHEGAIAQMETRGYGAETSRQAAGVRSLRPWA